VPCVSRRQRLGWTLTLRAFWTLYNTTPQILRSPEVSRSGQRRADYIVNPTARKEPEGSLDLRSWSLRGSGLRGFWLYCHSILPKQDFVRSTMCGSLLLNDRTVGGAPNDLPKSTALLYFVTSTFGEFDAIASPFSRSGTSPKSSRCRSNG
jgi:hypothetical protein